MPGRSQHHQFCRHDSDCLVEGDFCRGRVCTDLTTVSCRVIYETFGVGDRFGYFISGMSGWINGTDVALACKMEAAFPGFTRIFKSIRGEPFSRQTLRRFNMELADGVDSHSMLYLAEHLRRAGSEPTYQLRVFVPGRWYLNVDFQVPREEPVLSDAARLGVGSPATSSNFMMFSWTSCMPYLPASGPSLVTTNADSADGNNGAVAREDGEILWGSSYMDALYIYIRE